jgi:hypothetical protein
VVHAPRTPVASRDSTGGAASGNAVILHRKCCYTRVSLRSMYALTVITLLYLCLFLFFFPSTRRFLYVGIQPGIDHIKPNKPPNMKQRVRVAPFFFISSCLSFFKVIDMWTNPNN